MSAGARMTPSETRRNAQLSSTQTAESGADNSSVLSQYILGWFFRQKQITEIVFGIKNGVLP